MTRIRWLPGLVALLLLGGSVGLIGYLLSPLPAPDVPEASLVFSADGKLIARMGVKDRVALPLAEIPRHLQAAVIAQEDHRFYRHFGLDPIGIARAAVQNLRAGAVVEGGSTISQQLARTWYLSMERTFWRKIQEALLAIKIETHYSKDEILAHYLNSIYMGHGAWGMEVAAQTYFGKSARQVDLAEAAMLAGIIGSPENFTPHRWPERARERQLTVLERMVRHGYISAAEAAAAAERDVAIAPAPNRPGALGDLSDSAYFLDYVRHVLSSELPQVAADLERGGYRIYTTVDSRLQEAAVRRLREGLAAAGPDDAGEDQVPQGALVALDPHSGYIKALVGGRDFAESPFNRAYRARRQPGSAFKAFVYTAALAEGIPPTATQACEPVEYPGRPGEPPYRPQDHTAQEGEPYHYRHMTMREAVAISDNVVAVRWAHELGPRLVARYARSMGIFSSTPLEETLPLALGASTVTPLELTRAYAPLANLGYRVDPIAVLRVETAGGEVLYQQEPQREQVLDPAVAYVMTDLLKSVLGDGGTGAHLRTWFDGPAAGKTGTTNQRRSAWFVGYTPNLVTTVYVGYDDETPLWASGGAIAGPIWARFMADAADVVPGGDWTPPPNVVRSEVCIWSGSVFFPLPRRVSEVFVDGTVPPAGCF